MTAIPYYNTHAPALAQQYEALPAASVHSWLVDLLPKTKTLALDVGAGSGRDAAWLASLGFEVIAVEPSAGMRAEAQRLHHSAQIQWLDDSLPDFQVTQRLGLSFDVILLSAVWMHLPPADRPRAFRKLITLLKPGGLLALTLRLGPAAPERAMFEVSEHEIETLAKNHGAFIERRVLSSDQGGRT
jgi:SAM-dependent methyltransferase